MEVKRSKIEKSFEETKEKEGKENNNSTDSDEKPQTLEEALLLIKNLRERLAENNKILHQTNKTFQEKLDQTNKTLKQNQIKIKELEEQVEQQTKLKNAYESALNSSCSYIGTFCTGCTNWADEEGIQDCELCGRQICDKCRLLLQRTWTCPLCQQSTSCSHCQADFYQRKHTSCKKCRDAIQKWKTDVALLFLLSHKFDSKSVWSLIPREVIKEIMAYGKNQKWDFVARILFED